MEVSPSKNWTSFINEGISQKHYNPHAIHSHRSISLAKIIQKKIIQVKIKPHIN